MTVYKVSRSFPRDEIYGLSSQMRRASASIGANLAEGCCRASDIDFARFVQIAMGSASELEYHLLLARDLDLLTAPDYAHVADSAERIKRMLASLLKRLRRAA